VSSGRNRVLERERAGRGSPPGPSGSRRSCLVVRASSLELPFARASFGLVLSRHEEISPKEVVRVLAPDARFLTQQGVSDYWPELRALLPDMNRFPDHFSGYQREFTEAGLTVQEASEYRRPVRFRKLGHLVYHLVACPWIVPNFGVQSHRGALARLDEQIRSEQGLVLTEGFYLLQVHHGAATPIPERHKA
jgi:SAM-dependent methyltransferase